jgi:hypothetical protein
MALVAQNSLIGISVPETPEIRTEAILADSKHFELIECLAKWESGNNQNRKGQAGEIGCMQFLPSTFSTFKEKYQLKIDINSCEDQKFLANEMLNDDISNVKHWTTRWFCL